MSNTEKIVISLFFIGMAIICYGSPESIQKFKKEKERIVVIENKGSGMYGKEIMKRIKLTEVLSLGSENDKGPDYLIFGRYVMVDADLDQNIFVMDIQNYRLMKFDRDGHFLWKAGRQGQGPGEIEVPFQIKTLSNGGVVLVDQAGKLSFFDKNGNFQKIVKLEKTIKSIISFVDGNIFANLWIMGQPGIAAAMFSENGNLIKYFPIEYHYGPQLSPRMAYDLGGAFRLAADKIFLSLPDRYEIRVYSWEERLLKKATRDIKIRPPILENGYKFVVRDISGPCYLLSNGFLINKLTLNKEMEKGSESCLDFFNEKLEFLGSYPMPDDCYLVNIDEFDNFYFVKTDPSMKIIKVVMKII
jgi:hypothetical protein